MKTKDQTQNGVIVALDVPNIARLLVLLGALKGVVGMVKIGMELFTAVGSQAVTLAREHGFKVFLDLKFKDIPNTVEGAVRAAGGLGVSMVNIHLDGGVDMIRAAVKAAKDFPDMLLLGVTVLTSSTKDTMREVNFRDASGNPISPESQVIHLAMLGFDNGVRGIVCSPLEIEAVLTVYGPKAHTELTIVTPGVRSAGSGKHDQARTSTPEGAIIAGAKWVVCGRQITTAADPRAEAEKIIADIARAQAARP